MEEHSGDLVEKIIKELNYVLKIPGLMEFDIVPVESLKNKSPVLQAENSIGLESWCVKYVYMYCYSELMEDYLAKPKGRLTRISRINSQRLTLLLNAVILLNPDVRTLWTKRKILLEYNYLKWVPELQFSRLVLSRKPKCNDAFAYRQWILVDVLKMEVVHLAPFLEAIISEELDLCNMAADKCPNNYHCWDHRRWLLNEAWPIKEDFDYIRICFEEYRFTKEFTSNHVSDYSCFHYRQYIIKRHYEIPDKWPQFEKMMEINLRENIQKIVNIYMPPDPTVKPNKTSKKTIEDEDLIALVLGRTPGNCKCHATYYATCRKLELLFFEMVLNEDMLKFFKYHETLWYHRRFIVNEILATMYEYLDIERKNGKLVRKNEEPKKLKGRSICENCLSDEMKGRRSLLEAQDVCWVYECPLFKVLVKYEQDLITDRRKDSDKYADRHEHYLKYVEGLDAHF